MKNQLKILLQIVLKFTVLKKLQFSFEHERYAYRNSHKTNKVKGLLPTLIKKVRTKTEQLFLMLFLCSIKNRELVQMQILLPCCYKVLDMMLL